MSHGKPIILQLVDTVRTARLTLHEAAAANTADQMLSQSELPRIPETT